MIAVSLLSDILLTIVLTINKLSSIKRLRTAAAFAAATAAATSATAILTRKLRWRRYVRRQRAATPCGDSVWRHRAASACGGTVRRQRVAARSVQRQRVAAPCGYSVWWHHAAAACGGTVRRQRVTALCGDSEWRHREADSSAAWYARGGTARADSGLCTAGVLRAHGACPICASSNNSNSHTI